MNAAVPPVLIVDDDHDIRDTLKDVLEDEGYAVATAADGFEAIKYLQANPPPFVILLDWMMPHCDGAQFRALQREDPELAKIPVVLLTADARIEEKKREIEADGSLPKPVRLGALLDMVRKFYDAAMSG